MSLNYRIGHWFHMKGSSPSDKAASALPSGTFPADSLTRAGNGLLGTLLQQADTKTIGAIAIPSIKPRPECDSALPDILQSYSIQSANPTSTLFSMRN